MTVENSSQPPADHKQLVQDQVGLLGQYLKPSPQLRGSPLKTLDMKGPSMVSSVNRTAHMPLTYVGQFCISFAGAVLVPRGFKLLGIPSAHLNICSSFSFGKTTANQPQQGKGMIPYN